MNNLLKTYYNENFNFQEEPFESLNSDYKKAIEDTFGFQHFKAQKALNDAIQSAEDNIKKYPSIIRCFLRRKLNKILSTPIVFIKYKK
jgi:hypothetical protein